MLKKANFRDFFGVLQRTLVVSGVWFVAVFNIALANNTDFTISLNAGSGLYTNTPTSEIYGYSYNAQEPRMIFRDKAPNTQLINYMRPVPHSTNPVNVPNANNFLGYYDDDNKQCINTYGELTSVGGNFVVNQYSPGNTYKWNAKYSKVALIKLVSTDSPAGHHGEQEFLYYLTSENPHKLYRDYDVSTDAVSVEMNPTNASTNNTRISAAGLPTRNGYKFDGFWSVENDDSDPGVGIQYVTGETNNAVIPGIVTQAGLSAVAGYNGGVVNWYAHWEEDQHTLAYYCNPNSSQSVYYNSTVPASTVIHPGYDVNGNTIVCAAPSNGYSFVGWACGTNAGTFVDFENLSFYDINSASWPVVLTMTSSNQSWIMNTDLICVAMWYQTPSCEPGYLVSYTLGQENLSINMSLGPSTSSGNSDSVVFSYGTVDFEGMCSETAGVMYLPGNPVDNSTGSVASGYCWCRVTGFTPSGDNYTYLGEMMPWVYEGSDCGGDSGYECTSRCSKLISIGGEIGEMFRRNLYVSKSCAYSLKFNCNGGNYVNPYSSNNNTATFVTGSVYDVVDADNVCIRDNQVLNPGATHAIANGWVCTAEHNTSYVSQNDYWLHYDSGADNIWSYPDNYICNAQWSVMPIKLKWFVNNSQFYDNPSQCSYGALISNILQPQAVSGYSFSGWEVTAWNECEVTNYDIGKTASTVGYNPDTANSGSYAPGDEFNADLYQLTASTFALEFDYGLVRGEALCSSTVGNNSGNYNDLIGNPANTPGGQCWCRFKNLTSSDDNSQCIFTQAPWVFHNDYGSGNDAFNQCSAECAESCVIDIDGDPNFQAVQYGM